MKKFPIQKIVVFATCSFYFYLKIKEDSKIKEITPSLDNLKLGIFYLSFHQQGKRILFQNYSNTNDYFLKYLLCLNDENKREIARNFENVNEKLSEPTVKDKLQLFLYLNLFSKEYLKLYQPKLFLAFLKEYNQFKNINDYNVRKNIDIHIPDHVENNHVQLQLTEQELRTEYANQTEIKLSIEDMEALEFEISKFLLACYELYPEIINEKDVKKFIRDDNHLTRNPILYMKTKQDIYKHKIEYHTLLSKYYYIESDEYKEEILKIQNECKGYYTFDFFDFLNNKNIESLNRLIEDKDAMKDPDILYLLAQSYAEKSPKETLQIVNEIFRISPKYEPLKTFIYMLCNHKKYQLMKENIKLMDYWDVCK